MMVYNGVVIIKRIENSVDLVPFRHKYLRHISATKPKVGEDVFAQCVEFFFHFCACEHRYTVSIFAQHLRVVSKVVFKITVGVVAAGGNHCIKIFQFIHQSDLLVQLLVRLRH